MNERLNKHVYGVSESTVSMRVGSRIGKLLAGGGGTVTQWAGGCDSGRGEGDGWEVGEKTVGGGGGEWVDGWTGGLLCVCVCAGMWRRL